MKLAPVLGFVLLLGAAAPARAQGRAVRLSGADQRALNVFVSNFVEAGVEPFARGGLSNQARLRFGFLHTVINRQRFIEGDWAARDGLRLAPVRIAEAVRKYFDVGVERHEDVYDQGYLLARYDRGQYRFGWGDGETYPFGHVTGLRDTGGGTFEADVQAYQGEDVDYDPYGTTEADWRRRGLAVERLGRFRATLRRATGPARYVLTSWAAAP